jgi:hypothetical protein
MTEGLTEDEAHDNSSHFQIPVPRRLAGLEKIRERTDQLKLRTEGPPKVITGTVDGSQASDTCRNSSIKRYETVWRQLLDFTILIGDHDSGIILFRPECPADPPPVSLKTARLFLRMQCQKAELLMHHDTTRGVMCTNGRYLPCLYNWKGFSSVKIFAAALSKLHNHYETTSGVYSEKCDDCFKLGPERAMAGGACLTHAGQSHYSSRGNTAHALQFKTDVTHYENYSATHYDARCTFAFLPGELRDIFTKLTSTNDLFDLMVWTIIIVGVKLMLRVEEVLELSYDQFVESFSVVTADEIRGLVSESCDKPPARTRNIYYTD